MRGALEARAPMAWERLNRLSPVTSLWWGSPADARGLEHAKTPPHGRSWVAGQEQSHRDAHTLRASGCDAGRGTAGSDSLATCIRTFKGHMRGPDALDAALACRSGQACLLLFGVHMLVFAGIHCDQLLSEARFVPFPDRLLPHDSLTLRCVRVLDVVCCLCLGLLLTWLAIKLERGMISGHDGRNVLLHLLACLSAIYAVGALVDYVQCRYQGGGVGPQCHGYNCLRVSLITGATVAVGKYQPRFFCGVCFGGQGLYRLYWVLVEKREVWASLAVLLTSSVLLLFPAVIYFEDIFRWEIGRCKREGQAEDATGVQSKLFVRSV